MNNNLFTARTYTIIITSGGAGGGGGGGGGGGQRRAIHGQGFVRKFGYGEVAMVMVQV